MKVKQWIVLGTLSIIIFGNSCKHDTTSDVVVLTDTLCDPNTVYFVNDIQPIMTSSCAYSGCHDATTHAHGIDLSNYSSIMSSGSVKAGSPNNSEMYEKITDTNSGERMPPPPASSLSTDQKNKIRDWISQGALNNYCDHCDSSNVGFSATIWPIVQANCYSCHSGSSPDGGISLTNYSNVNTIALNGKLIGTITHASGYSAMPKGGKLSDCDINLIKIWVKNGSHND